MRYIEKVDDAFESSARTTVRVISQDIVIQLITISFTALKMVLLMRFRSSVGSH